MLEAGAGNHPGHGRPQTLLETLAHNARGRFSLAAWQRQGDRRAAYLRAVGLQNTAMLPMTAALRADQLVAVMNLEGSASCMDVSLFRPIGRRLVPISPPFVTWRINSCQRWGDSISLGSLDGIPFVVRVIDEDTDIQIAPWNGHGWDPICSVVVKYVPKLIAEGAFCRAAYCVGAEVEARRIAAHIPDEFHSPSTYQDGADPQLDRLVELAGKTPGTDGIPSSPNWTGVDFTQYLAPYIATVDGRPALAIAGRWKEGPAVDSELIGYAVAFWQESGDKLIPVAGFHLRIDHSTIKSVLVTR
jgi:hypothetical protein